MPFRHRAVLPPLVGVVMVAVVWSVRLVRLARAVGRNADYWSTPRGAAGGLLYVALGDSAAQGIGASNPAHGYVSLLADRLRQATCRPVQVVNLSRSGARLDDVLSRQLPALRRLGRTPDLVTVAIGGNDVRRYDRAGFAQQLSALMTALPAGSYVADVPYFMHGRGERDARQAADLVAAGAAAAGLQPVALHDAMRRRGARAMVTDYAADWFHPNDRGHRVWADAFWQAIRTAGMPGGTTGCVPPASS